MRKSLAAATVLLSGLMSLAAGAKAQAATEANAPKEWTMMVFLNGHNNLDRFGALNINQMEQVGSTEDINIVVQWASESAHPNATKRLLVQKDDDAQKVTSPIVQELGKVDMGDYRNLIEFVQWTVAHYPAKRYFIDVWDHGTGWHRLNLNQRDGAPVLQPTDISFDDATGNKITTAQLGIAMAESAKAIGHNVDLYASDACLMAMVEVAQEMAGSVDVFAGSEEVEPGAGWPYHAFLKRWAAAPSISAAEVSKILADEYVKSYAGSLWQVNFSSFDMTKLSGLNDSIRELGAQLRKLDKASAKQAMGAASKTLRFYTPDYADLGDFTVQLESTRTLDAAWTQSVRARISEFVLTNRYTPKFAKAQGVAIWLPTSLSKLDQYSERYKSLQFDGISGWSDTLSQLLKESSSAGPSLLR
jgi:hypothetical protein